MIPRYSASNDILFEIDLTCRDVSSSFGTGFLLQSAVPNNVYHSAHNNMILLYRLIVRHIRYTIYRDNKRSRLATRKLHPIAQLLRFCERRVCSEVRTALSLSFSLCHLSSFPPSHYLPPSFSLSRRRRRAKATRRGVKVRTHGNSHDGEPHFPSDIFVRGGPGRPKSFRGSS